MGDWFWSVIWLETHCFDIRHCCTVRCHGYHIHGYIMEICSYICWWGLPACPTLMTSDQAKPPIHLVRPSPVQPARFKLVIGRCANMRIADVCLLFLSAITRVKNWTHCVISTPGSHDAAWSFHSWPVWLCGGGICLLASVLAGCVNHYTHSCFRLLEVPRRYLRKPPRWLSAGCLQGSRVARRGPTLGSVFAASPLLNKGVSFERRPCGPMAHLSSTTENPIREITSHFMAWPHSKQSPQFTQLLLHLSSSLLRGIEGAVALLWEILHASLQEDVLRVMAAH